MLQQRLFEALSVGNNPSPVMLFLFVVAKQLAPIEHSHIEKIVDCPSQKTSLWIVIGTERFEFSPPNGAVECEVLNETAAKQDDPS
jgi:hypothetical protein